MKLKAMMKMVRIKGACRIDMARGVAICICVAALAALACVVGVFYRSNLRRYVKTAEVLDDMAHQFSTNVVSIVPQSDAWGRRVNITTNVNERILIFRSAGCDGKFETTDDVVAESQKSGDSSFLVRVSWHFWLESYDVIDGEIVTDE